jgi:hypothetical protein
VPASINRTFQEQSAGMTPLYLARIEDLGQGDLVKVDCAATWRCSGRNFCCGSV